MTMTKARDLQPGNQIDAEPIVEYLYEHHLCDEEEYDNVIFEHAIVEGVELEAPDGMATYLDGLWHGPPELAVISTDLGNWAIPAGMTVPRVALD